MMHLDLLFQRMFPSSQARTARRQNRRRLRDSQGGQRRTLHIESLEGRRVMAVLFAAEASGFTDAANPGNPQAGDAVTWNGGGQFTTPVSGLTFGTDAFTSINAAIAAANAGDTIEVAPGTYSEQVDVTKSVTLLGAQNGVDARTGRTGASESILDATANSGKTQLVIGADDVTIDGFTVQNETNSNVFGAAIYIQPGRHGTHVVNDIVENNQIGLYLANDSSVDQALVQHDLFQNNNQTGPGSGNGIYLDQSTAGGAVTNVLIDSNAFTNNSAAGVGLSSVSGAAVTSNVTISNNVFDANGSGIYAFETQNSRITNNTIKNSTGSGIGLYGDDSGVTITGNNITNSDTANNGGAGVEIGSYNDATPNSNVTINGNGITSAQGNNLQLDPSTASGATAAAYTGTLDASRNYWGTSDEATIISKISDSAAQVDFSPYLNNGNQNGNPDTPGFQADFSQVTVTSAGAHSGGVGPIEQAILATPAGGTVTIQAGTYAEDDVVIDKNLTLQGNGAVILQAPTNGSGTGITISGNPPVVSLAGLDIEGFHSSLQSSGGGTLNLIDLALGIINTGLSLQPLPLTVSAISNVSHLNLTTTTASAREVAFASGGVRFFDGNDSLQITNVSQLSATTGAGSDTFNVVPFLNTTITIDSGNPVPPATPGDALNMDLTGATGANLMITQDASGFSGRWTFANAKPVNFSHIETITPNTVTASGGQTITATETVNTGSQVVATFTDPANLPLADYSADINWGDGTSSAGIVTFNATSGVYSVSGSHTYDEDGSDQLAITVHRLGAPDVTLNGTATVVEPPLVRLFPPVAAPAGHEGAPINVTAGYFQHGANTEPASGFTATIDWGDGTTSAGTVLLSGSQYAVVGSHTYMDEGTFSVKAEVTDTSGGASLSLGTIAFIREALLPDGTEGTANQRFISELFSDLLHRPVDAGGLAYWSGRLDSGATRFQVAAGIENSDEYRQDEVDSLFEHYLHRHADAIALSGFNTFLKDGGTDEQLAAVLVGSDEYFSQRGGGTNDGFLNALFQDALNRPIDAGGKADFEQFLSGGGSRRQVAEIVFGSDEYHADLVRNVYLDSLDRAADAGGQSYFAALLGRGATDEQVRAILMGSDEYFAKTSD